MKNAKSYGQGPVIGTSSGSVFLVIGVLAICAAIGYWANDRIHSIHRELFNAEAPVTYDVDFGNMQVIASAKIISQPRPDMARWKEFPIMSQSQVYRITHRIGVGSHRGTIELKVGDNAKNSEFLSSDIFVDFTVGTGDVSMEVKPFEYSAPDFKLIFSDLSGTFSLAGNLKLRVKTLEVKMVNYLFRLSDVAFEVPEDRKTITILASKINFDDVNLGHSKVVFMGTNPFEINLQSTFENQPVEIHWNIQKTLIEGQDMQVGSGQMNFPTALLNAYVDPKINRQLLSQEQTATNSGSDKMRFLFSAAKEVKRAEARALTLRALTSLKNLKRDGEFYQIRIDKQDAFQGVEERAKKVAERKTCLDTWRSLPKDKMYEDAFYSVIFGDENRALAVKEFLEEKKETESGSLLYKALALRSDLREAKTGDAYDLPKVEKLAEKLPALTAEIADHKFLTLIRFELARARGDKALVSQVSEEFRTKESEPQILALMEFQKNLHTDNAKALEALDKAAAINPQSSYVKNLIRERIHVHQHLGQKEKVDEDFRLLLAGQKPTDNDLLTFSKILEEKKQINESLQAIDKCIEMNPVNKDCQEQKEKVMTLVAFEKQKENPDAAIAYLENLVIDHPASVAANSGLGYLYRMKGDRDKSIKHYSVACALGGSFACVDAGDYLASAPDPDRALLLYDISCDLKSGTGCLKAGLISETSGQVEKSGDYFDRSCNQFQDNVGCYHLARNLRRKNAPNRSIATYLSKACKLFSSACQLASTYQKSNKQPEIPLEPK